VPGGKKPCRRREPPGAVEPGGITIPPGPLPVEQGSDDAGGKIVHGGENRAGRESGMQKETIRWNRSALGT